ncbi:MAG TPA: PTS sugar transporter subunit IIA [Glaciihabitans sp.]|jgi:PTS system ascorbate-specific IIA component|nr:PTS sugar transporter subunit IIA [Glaciihabitans sp.]
MSLPPLSAETIVLGAEVEDWRGAVRAAGAALASSGATLPAYGEEMVRMIEEHGPYVVIAPGLALAHARPGPEVLTNGLAIVTLATPVNFGHPHNDPVSVVLGLAVASAEAHLASVAQLANVFNDDRAIPALAAATSVEEVQKIMGVSS